METNLNKNVRDVLKNQRFDEKLWYLYCFTFDKYDAVAYLEYKYLSFDYILEQIAEHISVADIKSYHGLTHVNNKSGVKLWMKLNMRDVKRIVNTYTFHHIP